MVIAQWSEHWWLHARRGLIIRAGGCPVVIAQWSEHWWLHARRGLIIRAGGCPVVIAQWSEHWWLHAHRGLIIRAGGCPVVIAQWSEHWWLKPGILGLTPGDKLPYQREQAISKDPFAVVVGHFPNKLSAVCLVFLRQSGVNSLSLDMRLDDNALTFLNLWFDSFGLPDVLIRTQIIMMSNPLL